MKKMSSYKDINKKWSLVTVACILFLLIKMDSVIAVQDNNTINNNMVKYVNVTSTRTMSILYVPIDQIEADYSSNVDNNHEFLQETYPLREEGINKIISQEVYDSNNVNFSTFKYGNYFGACGFLRKFNKERRLTQDQA